MTAKPQRRRAQLARAEQAAADPRIRESLIVFLGRGGLGVLGALAVAAILAIAQLAPDLRVNGLSHVALLAVGLAVITLGLVLHPRVRRAAEDRARRIVDAAARKSS